MTISIERTNALINTRKFLLELLDPKSTPRVPKYVRRNAYWALSHYPFKHEILEISKCKKCRKIIG